MSTSKSNQDNDDISIIEQPVIDILPVFETNKVAELAYFKAEGRGFEPGFELEDWLAAERELTVQ